MATDYSTELYLKIIDQMPNPIWRAGIDSKCNFFNKCWLDFTGKTMEQEMGNGWAEGVHKDDYDSCLKIYTDAFKKQEHFEMEYRLKHKDGSYHWILDSGSPFYDENNTFLGYIGSCYDINKDKQQQLLFKNMTNGFAYHKIITDSQNNPIDYEFLDLNNAFEEIVSKKKEELVGKKVTEIFPGIEKDPANWIGRYGEVALTGKEVKFENYSEGVKKWFYVSAYSPITGYFVTLFEDISARKQAEQDLQKKLEELQNMNKLMVGRELKMVELKKQLESSSNTK